jgi:prolipoprotein diacylglyceryltransferase
MGMGMGVPIFCILSGFLSGWYITQRVSVSTEPLYQKYYQIFKYSLMTVIFTFILMLVVWGRTIPMIFNPSSDFQNFGHPFILYDPKMSFIGWSILMILISPFLQLLTTIFAAFITLIRNEKKLERQSI